MLLDPPAPVEKIKISKKIKDEKEYLKMKRKFIPGNSAKGWLSRRLTKKNTKVILLNQIE